MGTMLVLGAGLMGRAMAWDLSRRDGIDRVLLVDNRDQNLELARRIIDSPRLETEVLDINANPERVRQLMKMAAVTIGAVSYHFNFMLARLAVDCGTHFLDLGGNDRVVEMEHSLNTAARAAGVSIIPDCGLAPGLADILGQDLAGRLDRCDELHLRVGGLPQEPRPPLNYMLLFSVKGLVNEYKEEVKVVRDFKTVPVEGMSEIEEIEFPAPFGIMEAFATSGGLSTLPQTLSGRVKDMDYKTIRHPGHAEKIRFLLEMGFFEEEPPLVYDISARRASELILERKLAMPGKDVTLMRVWARGLRDGKKTTLSQSMIDYHDDAGGFSSMARTTGFPVTAIAAMLHDGVIRERGTLHQQLVVPVERLLADLAARGIKIDYEEKIDA